ncbi:MAG: hypothetical protein Q4D04_12735 [Clostridia bacterium]|nr:hypothetical protein [Clostridia bacterium]
MRKRGGVRMQTAIRDKTDEQRDCERSLTPLERYELKIEFACRIRQKANGMSTKVARDMMRVIRKSMKEGAYDAKRR